MQTNINYTSTGEFDGVFPMGFRPVAERRAMSVRREARLAEATQLWLDVLDGGDDPYMLRQAMNPTSPIAAEILCRRYPVLFNETMGTSDFTALTAEVLDRMIIANYNAAPQTWQLLMRQAPLRDFRTVSRRSINGAEAPWSSVPEFATHTRQHITETNYTYAPLKYESGSEPISWEAMVNDDLGIFRDLPQRFATGGVRTVEKFATGLYCDASGPHASLYTSGNNNIVNITNGAAATNPPLSLVALGDAIMILGKMLDSGGDPIVITGALRLVVGPGLLVTATNLKNQLLTRLNEKGGSANSQLEVNNWIAQNFTVVMNPYIPIIATSANAATSWWLIADPAAGNRPAFEIGQIRGYDAPVLLEKAGNTIRQGGGIVQELGDYDSMAREMKGLLTVGGTRLDGKCTVASNGSGS